jgi:hypothetical protein
MNDSGGELKKQLGVTRHEWPIIWDCPPRVNSVWITGPRRHMLFAMVKYIDTTPSY